jgi:hypothetical protein
MDFLAAARFLLEARAFGLAAIMLTWIAYDTTVEMIGIAARRRLAAEKILGSLRAGVDDDRGRQICRR